MNNSGKPTELKLGAVERLAQLTKVVNTAFVMRPKQAIDSIIGEQSIDQEKIERCTIVSVILMDFFYPKDQTALDLHLLLSMDEREDILKSLDCIKDGSDYSKLVIASLIPMIEGIRKKLFEKLSKYLTMRKVEKSRIGRILMRLEELTKDTAVGGGERHIQRGFNTAFIEFFNSIYLIPIVFYRQESFMISPEMFREITDNQERVTLLLSTLNSDTFLPLLRSMYPIIGFMPDSYQFSLEEKVLSHIGISRDGQLGTECPITDNNNPRFGCPALYVKDEDHGNLIIAMWRNLITECDTLFFPYIKRTVIL